MGIFSFPTAPLRFHDWRKKSSGKETMLEPQQHTFDSIWGHVAARQFVPRLLGQARLPHAMLLCGPDGIGKRSLAFAMAKAILSAGMPVQPSTLGAPGTAMAKRKVPQDDAPEPEDDLFGGGDSGDDLFAAAEQDMFGSTESEPEPVAAPAPQAPVRQRDEVRQPAPEMSAAGLVNPEANRRLSLQRPFLGYDPRVCRLVEAGYPVEWNKDNQAVNPGHMDLTIIEPIGNRRGVVVDQVRNLQELASVSPMEGSYRVVLIFGADTITQEGGNSILKLLEEPPPYLILILVANRLPRVLPTIRSRCAIIPMAPLDRETLVRHLMEEERLAPEVAKVAAALSEGRPGAALATIKAGVPQKRREVFEGRLQLDRFGISALAAAVARVQAGGNLEETLWLLTSFTRDRMIRLLAPQHPNLLVHEDVLDLIDQIPGDLMDLDGEADRLIRAFSALDHPFVPNSRAVVQEALWPE